MEPTSIERSFELAAEQVSDVTARVYEKLFARYPEMQPLFVRDKTGTVRGEMLARTIDVILDSIDRNTYGENFVRCEVITHEGYGVPREVFPRFFEAIVSALREILGADWTPAMEHDWNALLARYNILCEP